jgi:hypothetical protein
MREAEGRRICEQRTKAEPYQGRRTSEEARGRQGTKVTGRGSEIGCGKGEGGTRLSRESIERTEKRQVAKNKKQNQETHAKREVYMYQEKNIR